MMLYPATSEVQWTDAGGKIYRGHIVTDENGDACLFANRHSRLVKITNTQELAMVDVYQLTIPEPAKEPGKVFGSKRSDK